MQHYKRLAVLGSGSFGTVYKAQHVPTGRIVAVKKNQTPEENVGIPAATLREVAIHLSLHSPFIIRLEKVVTQVMRGTQLVFLVLEYLDCDLRSFMISRYGTGNGMDLRTAKTFCFQILLGLYHCHAQRVMHRDLTPANLLVDIAKRTVKLADFGLSRRYDHQCGPYSSKVVALWYRAPELLLGSQSYSAAVDLWSVGCILAFMLRGSGLFEAWNELEQTLKIFSVRGTPSEKLWPTARTLRYWHDYPEWKPVPIAQVGGWPRGLEREALELMDGLLQLDPEKRMSVVEALNSPYFDSIRGQYAGILLASSSARRTSKCGSATSMNMR